jgi:hypothetical protein
VRESRRVPSGVRGVLETKKATHEVAFCATGSRAG